MDVELMEWLEKYAFKEERKFKSNSYAKKAYSLFVDAVDAIYLSGIAESRNGEAFVRVIDCQYNIAAHFAVAYCIVVASHYEPVFRIFAPYCDGRAEEAFLDIFCCIA